MEALHKAIYTTPIIDNHAHNILQPSKIRKYDLLNVATEAEGDALQDSTSCLAHIRAVKQLSEILKCEPRWEEVKKALSAKHSDYEEWAKECFDGLETILIDDGFGDPSEWHPYDWHSRLTRSKCKRIVRIESVAEDIIQNHLERKSTLDHVIDLFSKAVVEAIEDPEVVGFKSIICYRTGLAIPEHIPGPEAGLKRIVGGFDPEDEYNLQDEDLAPYFVNLVAKLLTDKKCKKPFQFHTGLGDNDLSLTLSSAAHLQPFIKKWPEVVFVLLHASYPFTTDAGYIASVHKNAYLDIGEVFPYLSQDGQERVVRECLDLVPSEKLLWSTDGHWFPETYLLAVKQIREALEVVLGEYVQRGAVTEEQAVRIVEDLLFNTSNRLYDLDLELKPLKSQENCNTPKAADAKASSSDVARLERFLKQNQSVKFLRFQWVDYTATVRARVLPISQALKLYKQRKNLGISKAALGLLQTDFICSNFSPVGEDNLVPDFTSLRLSSRETYAFLQCEFRETESGKEVANCPRSALRHQVEKGKQNGFTFKVGFEIEVVFMRRSLKDSHFIYHGDGLTEGHNWTSASSLRDDKILSLVEAIATKLEVAGIEVLQFHAESSPCQFEFALGALPPLEAADTLIAARDIISTVTANHLDGSYHATLYPKPFKTACGTGAHIHMSVEPGDKWEHFIAAVLRNLRAMSAILYSNEASYARVVDSLWAGSTWIAWGPQNREAPLRQIEGSHFEVKCTDGLANPYLVLAALIGTGLGGLLEKAPLEMKACQDNPAELTSRERKHLGITEQFPKGIRDALSLLEEELENVSGLKNALGQDVIRTYVTVKATEMEMLEEMDDERRKNWLIERY
ncbi:uncharacterized protein KY384_004823 [Bacidia gigantensis]|uniref:uncharacterized protein n=1 Tax=Bacidia gigantensis TaxID=2732470 RepID=UPI001D053E01|nr:uncharacterized protein KY384_004823 [Bacidia gigantensis]KAG8530321.1 hypothetical protein KY384_004823 [Bacidia gigantensis]